MGLMIGDCFLCLTKTGVKMKLGVSGHIKRIVVVVSESSESGGSTIIFIPCDDQSSLF
jgi:hypothetical protein